MKHMMGFTLKLMACLMPRVALFKSGIKGFIEFSFVSDENDTLTPEF